MARNVARYAVTYGLLGCYMPDSGPDTVAFSTRRDMAAYLRSELAFYEMPLRLLRDVRLRRLWGFISRNGSSVAHFSLEHKGCSLRFDGLTEEEWNEYNPDEDR